MPGKMEYEVGKIRVDAYFRTSAANYLAINYKFERESMIPRAHLIKSFQDNFGQVDAAQIGKIVKHVFPEISEKRSGPRGAAKRQYVGLSENDVTKCASSPGWKFDDALSETNVNVLPNVEPQKHAPSLNCKRDAPAEVENAAAHDFSPKRSNDGKENLPPVVKHKKTKSAETKKESNGISEHVHAASYTHFDSTKKRPQPYGLRSVCTLANKSTKRDSDLSQLSTDILQIIDAGLKGRGVAVTRRVDKGTPVCLYGGQLISDPEQSAKLLDSTETYSTGEISYMFEFVNNGHVLCLDATHDDGGFGRLINHSRIKPNIVPRKVVVDGVPNICFFARKTIEAGEELLYDYNSGNLPEVAWLST